MYRDKICGRKPTMRYFTFILILVLLCLPYSVSGQANLHVSAKNAVLLEQSSGRILYEKNAHERQSIASITKIMTAIIAIESKEMGNMAKASKRAIYTEGSSIYLEQKEKMKIKDLVYGLMLRSGNDAAVTISEHVGGSVEGFVYLMNEKARWLGMTNTHFDNPHGLDSDKHYSTAYDMAILMRYAMENDQFKQISGTTFYQAETRSYGWQNKNKLLTSLYKNCTGGKTGFTKKSGRTLASTAGKGDLNLIAITLDAPDDWRDHVQMFEWGFEHYDLDTIAESGISNYKIKDTERHIPGLIQEDIPFPLTAKETEKLRKETRFTVDPEDDFEQDIIGKTSFYLEEKRIAEVPIFRVAGSKHQDHFFKDFVYHFKQMIGVH